MRLTGLVSGKVDYHDRPHWMGEIFTRVWSPALPDVCQWSNISAIGGAGIWRNVPASYPSAMVNISASGGSGAWSNISGSLSGG